MKNNNNEKQIVVGMSGGVDSSMALVLLKKQGWQPIGVSLKYAIWQDKKNLLRENACCSTESFEIARSVCKRFS
jgi:tRNA-specific 2-thiouridylase